LRLALEFGLGLAFFKDLCDNSEDQKLTLNMGGKFEVRAGMDKPCRRLSVTAHLLGLRWCLAVCRIRDATAEVVSPRLPPLPQRLVRP